jgi:hypothetical protein
MKNKEIKSNVLKSLIDFMKGEQKASWESMLKGESEMEDSEEEDDMEDDEEEDMPEKGPKGVIVEETVIIAKPKKKKK